MNTLRNFIVLLFLLPVSAFAGIITSSEFTGTHSEGFETIPDLGFPLTYENLFGGTATAVAESTTGGALNITGGWSFESLINPYSGSFFMGTTGGPLAFEFDQALSAFGGFFGVNHVADTEDAPNGLAAFFDESDNLLAEVEISLGMGGSWTWNGWISAEENIAKVILTSGFHEGGLLMVDDLQSVVATTNVTNVPEPQGFLLMMIALVFFAQRRIISGKS